MEITVAAPDSIRAFVALRIPEEIISGLSASQQKLKREVQDISWTRPEAMHITLRFLGNVAFPDLEQIEMALNRVASCTKPFPLQVYGIGSFGDRVLWAGLCGDEARLAELAHEVRDTVARFGSHEEDRDFKGHVTIGRARRPRGGLNGKLRPLAERDFGSWTVDRLELIRSELSPHGSRYTTLMAPKFGSF